MGTTRPAVAGSSGLVTFAVIGDYGQAGQPAADVAALVHGWSPDFIVTAGDNNYDVGAASTIDANIGQYYHAYIHPYTGSYGAGATINRFFPSLGNHDWGSLSCSPDCAGPYFDYFSLPGNERYYDVIWGNVHLFIVDSDSREPDGITAGSTQAAWLQNGLAASPSTWKLVVFHHTPYSSGVRPDNIELRWPFAAWGATAVLYGHDHFYERLAVDGIPYIVNGLGGRSIYGFGEIDPHSLVRYNGDYGALRVTAATTTLTFEFFNRAGTLIDSHTLTVEPTAVQLYLPLVTRTSVAATWIFPLIVIITLTGLTISRRHRVL